MFAFPLCHWDRLQVAASLSKLSVSAQLAASSAGASSSSLASAPRGGDRYGTPSASSSGAGGAGAGGTRGGGGGGGGLTAHNSFYLDPSMVTQVEEYEVPEGQRRLKHAASARSLVSGDYHN